MLTTPSPPRATPCSPRVVDPFNPGECGWRTHEVPYGPAFRAAGPVVVDWGGHSQEVTRLAPVCLRDGYDSIDAVSSLILAVVVCVVHVAALS